jgi:membrane protein required for colicin V production
MTATARTLPGASRVATGVSMNGFDLALVAVVGLSVLFAFARGVVRELIAVATWIAAFIAAFAYAAPVAATFTALAITPVAKHVLAFALILIAVLVVGAVIAHMLSGAVRAIGLGFLDRLLGALFGFARGLAVVVLFALIAGVTTLPARDWWQNSTFGRPLADAALSFKPYLPRAWAERLDFSPDGKTGRSMSV